MNLESMDSTTPADPVVGISGNAANTNFALPPSVKNVVFIVMSVQRAKLRESRLSG